MPSYEELITPIRGITVRNVKIGKTATPFRILGDEREPVRDVILDNINISTADSAVRLESVEVIERHVLKLKAV